MLKTNQKQFHIPASVGEIGRYCILPGDPGRVEAIAAYNIGKPMHPKKNGWLGYVVTLGGKRIYIAGDTDVTPDAEAVRCDIAMVPVGGIYTMNAKYGTYVLDTETGVYTESTETKDSYDYIMQLAMSLSLYGESVYNYKVTPVVTE